MYLRRLRYCMSNYVHILIIFRVNDFVVVNGYLVIRNTVKQLQKLIIIWEDYCKTNFLQAGNNIYAHK